MDDRKPPEYRISLDDEPPDSIFMRKPVKSPRQKTGKQSRWVMPTVAVLVFIAAAALVIGYLDIRDRIKVIQSSGTQKAEDIAIDLQSKFSSLSLKFAKLEDEISRLNTALTEKTTEITKTTATLQKAADSLQTDIQQSRSALEKLKADKENGEKKLAALSSETAKINSSLSAMEKTLQDNQAATAAELKKALTGISALQERTIVLSDEMKPLKTLSASMNQQEALMENRFKEEAVRIDRAITQSMEKLTAQLQTLKEKLTALEQVQKKQAEVKPPAVTKPVTPRVEGKPSPPATPKPAKPLEKEPVLPKPGELIERDIRQ